METSSLVHLRDLLKSAHDDSVNLWISKAWLQEADQDLIEASNGDLVLVPSAQFYRRCIDNILERTPIARNNQRDFGDEVIYGAFLRSVTCVKRPDGGLDPGSMLRLIAILPHLINLGVTCLYLLPVTKMGERHRKGTLGSPYSTQSFYSIEPTLHEPCLGQPTDELLSLQLSALVQAAHYCGIRVILDISLRTVSRDSELIRTHPEAFYWRSTLETDGGLKPPPSVPGLPVNSPLTEASARSLYGAPGLDSYRDTFRPSPSVTDPILWKSVQDRSTSPTDLLKLIEEEFCVTTSPAFSDCINDEQPLWTDITYLRYYLEEWGSTQGRPDQVSPYCLQDSAALNVGARRDPASDFLGMMTDIPAWWIATFGLDGVRIDSAHALSRAINDEVVRKCRRANPNGLLWGEGFSQEDAAHLGRSGFDIYTGTSWTENSLNGNSSTVIQLEDAPGSIRPLAAAELHDSPRLWSRLDGNEVRGAQLLVNLAARKEEPLLIMAGLELGEVRPMNLGLEPDEHLLEQRDVFLPLFDAQELSWQKINSPAHIAVQNACHSKRYAGGK